MIHVLQEPFFDKQRYYLTEQKVKVCLNKDFNLLPEFSLNNLLSSASEICRAL